MCLPFECFQAWKNVFNPSFVVFRACFQISKSSYLGVHETLEEFLGKWSRVDERCYVLVNSEADMDDWSQTLEVEEYVKVVEIYVSALLGADRWNHAVSWVEKASLPEDTRQVYLNMCTSS